MCKFPAGFFHVNVYDTGRVCMSILGKAWKPSITVQQILVSVQELLDSPNTTSPAQLIINRLFAKVLKH
ncbi:hypothetical protein PR202_gb14600 [Eleusine coracana subsp. coracana]|uniref:UBC core domain-containing protein n=1 Tax=Eleusine coracana subsp. coracana TaxID=191504 RepID=A0AAV5EVK8_ELECO|nr:hypothetical protein PR202_gb14600 [Eleusine coracana subsp. coracana]